LYTLQIIIYRSKYSDFTDKVKCNCHVPPPGRNCMNHCRALQGFPIQDKYYSIKTIKSTYLYYSSSYPESGSDSCIQLYQWTHCITSMFNIFIDNIKMNSFMRFQNWRDSIITHTEHSQIQIMHEGIFNNLSCQTHAFKEPKVYNMAWPPHVWGVQCLTPKLCPLHHYLAGHKTKHCRRQREREKGAVMFKTWYFIH
jgi:hypothetical protein